MKLLTAIFLTTILFLTSCTHKEMRNLCYFNSMGLVSCVEVKTSNFTLHLSGKDIPVEAGTNDVCVELETLVVTWTKSPEYSCIGAYATVEPDPELDGIVGGVIGQYDNNSSSIENWRAIVAGEGDSLSGYYVQMESGKSQPIDVIFNINDGWAMFDKFGDWYSWKECGLAVQGDPTSGDNLSLNEYGRTSWQQECINQRGWKIICEDTPTDEVCSKLKDLSWPY